MIDPNLHVDDLLSTAIYDSKLTLTGLQHVASSVLVEVCGCHRSTVTQGSIDDRAGAQIEGPFSDNNQAAVGGFGHNRYVHHVEAAVKPPCECAPQIHDGDRRLAPPAPAHD